MNPMDFCSKLLSYPDSDSMAEVLRSVGSDMREAAVELFLCTNTSSVDMESKMLKVATAFIKIIDYPLAEKLLKHLENFARASRNDSLLLRVMGTIGTMYLEAEQLDLAKEYAEAALAQAEAIGDQFSMEPCTVNLAIIASERHDYALALEKFRLGVEIAREIDDRSGVELCQSNLNVTINRLINAIISTKKKDEIHEIVQSLLNRNLFDYAIEAIVRTVHQCEYDINAENYRKGVLEFLRRVGDDFLRLNRYVEAHKVYNYGIPIAQFINAVQTEAELMLNLANLTFIIYGKEEASEIYTYLVEFCEKNSIPDIAVYGLISWGGTCENQKDHSEALIHYKSAHAIAEANGLSDLSLKTSELIVRLLRSSGDEESDNHKPLNIVITNSQSPDKTIRTMTDIDFSEVNNQPKTKESEQEEPLSPLIVGKFEDLSEQASSSINTRYLRVFISSTFNDMHAERDLLLKRVFPKIRRLCTQRYVHFTAVDLGWGITDEQAASGQIIPICLREIDRSRPHFICMLGDRYGSTYHLTDSHHTMLEKYPWLAKAEGKSFTELEIMHGVLNDPANSKHAYFYFRDPRYTRSISNNVKKNIPVFPSFDQFEVTGLQQLKENIRQHSITIPETENAIRYISHHAEPDQVASHSFISLRENYTSPEQFAGWVTRDLIELIDFLYPEDNNLSLLNIEHLNHQMFARQHLGFYVEDEKLFARLDHFANSDGPPMVICGDTGMGKSALITNWVNSFQRRTPAAKVIEYYIGATEKSVSPIFMLQYLIQELGRQFGFATELPDDPDLLIHTFRDCLYNTSNLGRAIIVIDGLSQLTDEVRHSYLPLILPPNIRLLLSVNPGPLLEEFKARNWICVDIQQFENHRIREAFINKYLVLYSKSIGYKMMQRIVNEPMCRNPLFLRVFLDELLMLGKHEEIDSAVSIYLEAKTLSELFDHVLARLERDYDKDFRGLIQKIMAFLWLERYLGIEEFELLELISWPNPPVPQIVIEPLMLTGGSVVVNRAGALFLANTAVWNAVSSRYMSDRVIIDAIALMSKYRKIHPDSAQKKLNAFLDKLGSTGNEGLDASKAWTRVSLGQTTISPIDTKAIMDRFKSLQNQEAEMRKSGQLFQLAHCLTEQIFHILDAAETPLGPVLLPLEMALEKICEVEAISRKVFLSTNDVRLKGFLGTTLGLKGLVCSKLNLMEDALKSYSESIDILKPLTKSRDAAIKGSLRDSLINEGNLLARMGRYDAADRCYDEASRLGD